MITMGYIYQDYTQLSVTAVEQSYDIGTDSGAVFVGEVVTFQCTKDCYVRFNGSASVQTLIPANDYLEFPKKTWRIYVQRVSEDSTLNIWAEGNLKR